MLLVSCLLALGTVAGRFGGLPAGTAAALDRVVILLALPALIVREVPQLTPSPSMGVPLAVAWSSTALLILLVGAVGHLRGYDRRTLGTLLVVVPLGNTSFLGLPAVAALLGDAHLGPALVYDQLGSFVALVTWGSFAAASWGSGVRPDVASMVRRLLSFPPFLALGVAVAMGVLPPPAWIAGPVLGLADVLASMLVPLTMLSVGLRLRWPSRLTLLEPLLVGLALRMVVAPGAAWSAMVVAGGGGVVWQASVLECAMPPMVTASVVATAAGLDEELASGLAGVGVLLAMASLPLWAGVLGG